MNSLFSGSVAIPHHPRCALAALLLAGAALASGAAAATTYQIIQLPPPPGRVDVVYPFAISEAGEIVGYAARDNVSHAIAWSAAPDYTPRWLPDGDAIKSFAWGINDAGYVIGGAYFADSTNEQAMMWGLNDVPVRLGPPPGGQTGSRAYDINANGTIVGTISDGNGLESPAFWLTPVAAQLFVRLDGFFDEAGVTALNDFGTVVGAAHFWNRYVRDRAFRATPGGDMELLDELPGDNVYSYAYNVNEAGQAVGVVRTLDAERAVLWNADGSLLDLGELPGGSDFDYFASGINNAGEVVGNAGEFGATISTFVWTAATGMQDIVDLIDPLDPWYEQLQSGTVHITFYDLNDAGVMVGIIVPADPGPYTPIVLVPQP